MTNDHTLNDVEMWLEATSQQVARVNDGLTSGAWFTNSGPDVRLDADIHLLVVAAEHLRKALLEAPAEHSLGVLPPDVADPVEMLRDVFEHRDEHLRDRREGRPPRRAALRLSQYGGDPFVTSWGPDDFTIGRALSLSRLAAAVDTIRQRLRNAQDRPSDSDTTASSGE